MTTDARAHLSDQAEALSPRRRGRAMTYSIVAGGFGALFLTVCNNQPIFNVYMLNHLGVSPRLLGALLAFMQLSGVLQLLSIFIYGSLPRRKVFYIACHLIHRLSGLGVAASAAIFAAGAGRNPATLVVVAAMCLSWIAMNLSASGWMSWMADLIPEESRGSFFLKRSAIFNLITVAWFFLASVVLDLFPEEQRSHVYIVVFGIGALGGVADILLHLTIPEPLAASTRNPPSPADFGAPLRDRNFLRYSLAVGLGALALYFATPFQAPYITSPSAIAAPMVWLGIMTVISLLTWVAMAPLWGFVMDRYGRKPVVMLGCLTSLAMLGYVVLSPRNYVYVLPLLSLISGFFGPAFWEGSNQLMLTLAPAERRVVYIAWYNTILGAVSALGPLGGGLLIEALSGFHLKVGGLTIRGFQVDQLASLALMGAALLSLKGVREGKERPVVYLVSQFASAGIFRSFASLGSLNRDSGDPRVARALRRIDREDGDMVLREVLERLDDPSPDVREEAARALGRIGSKEATSVLIEQVTDPSSAIRIDAARALGRIADERAVPALASCIAEASPEIRAACAEALGSIGGDEAREALMAALSGEREHAVVAMGAEAASRSQSRDAAEGPLELLEAVQELFPRLTATKNAALRRQYSIALGNILGKPGGFYRYITGEESGRAERCSLLYAGFRSRIEAVLNVENEGDDRKEASRLFEICARALEAERGRETLAACLALHDMTMVRLFGASAGEEDFPDLAGRADLRLGAWCWIAREAARRLGELDEDSSRVTALLGFYYLGSGI